MQISNEHFAIHARSETAVCKQVTESKRQFLFNDGQRDREKPLAARLEGDVDTQNGSERSLMVAIIIRRDDKIKNWNQSGKCVFLWMPYKNGNTDEKEKKKKHITGDGLSFTAWRSPRQTC